MKRKVMFFGWNNNLPTRDELKKAVVTNQEWNKDYAPRSPSVTF